jgi:hypothetical protein
MGLVSFRFLVLPPPAKLLLYGVVLALLAAYAAWVAARARQAGIIHWSRVQQPLPPLD